MSPEKINRIFWVRYQVALNWEDIEMWYITASVEYKPWYYFITKKYSIKTITVGQYKRSTHSEADIIRKANQFIPQTCDNTKGAFKPAITELEKR